MEFAGKLSGLQKILGAAALAGSTMGIGGYAMAGERNPLMQALDNYPGRKDLDSFSTANSYEGDKNGNGTMDKEEFAGYGKRKFSRDEKICFFADLKNRIGDRIKFKIVDSKGREVVQEVSEIVEKERFGKIYSYEPGKFGEGKYEILWTLEDTKTGEKRYSSRIKIEVSD